MLLLVGVVLTAAVLLSCARYGTRALLPLALLVSFALTAVVSPVLGVAALMGFIAAVQVERQRGYGQIIATAATPAAVQALLLLVAANKIAREEAAELVLEQMRQFEAYGVQPEMLRELVALTLRFEPGLQFVFALLTAVLAYRLSLSVGGHWGIALPPVLPFRLWRPWEQLIWVLIGALALYLVGSGSVADLAANLMLVMGAIYAVQGLALLRFYLWRRRVSRLVEVLIYLGLFFSERLGLITLAGLGLLDTWFDWRHLGAAESPPDEE